MARYMCGGGAADWAFVFDADGDAAKPPPGTEATFWDALSGGNQYVAATLPGGVDDGTGLLDGAGSPISSVTLDSDGFLPGDAVQTPDGVTRMAIDASGGSGPRRWISPNDPVALSVAAQQLAQAAQDTANAALAAAGSGRGGGTVTKVAGRSPDGTGNVALTSGDVGALAAGPGNSVGLAINDQLLRVDIADEDNTTSPNRVEYAFQGGVTFYQNEYGELRVIAARGSTTPIRAIANVASQTGDLFQACDNARNPLGGFRSNGAVYGPNVGNARTSKGTTSPAAPTIGEIWVDTSQNPPVLKVYDGSLWITPSGAGGGEPPAAAPGFVDATGIAGGNTLTSYTPDKPSGATLVVFAAWNSNVAPATIPAGLTLVDEVVTVSARAGVWVGAAADVASLPFAWAAGVHASFIVLGYEQCSVLAHAGAADGSTTNVHTAPALAVGTVPATVLRLFFDKISPNGTAQTATDPSGTTRRTFQAPTGTAVCTLLAADEEMATAGTAAAKTSTYSNGAGTPGANCGGLTIALVAAA